MTVTDRKGEAELTPVSRIFLKQSGLVVRIIRSASGSEYKVVWMDNRVVGCEQVDGNPCKAWAYRRKCHHATLVTRLESARLHPPQKKQEPYASRLHNGVTLDRYNESIESQNSPSQKGALSSASGKGFSLLK